MDTAYTEGSSMEDQGYNGYTNYETWAVSMFLDGNYDGEGTYLTALETVKEARDNAIFANAPTFAVANALEAFTRECVESDEYTGLAGDLLGAALTEVNWYELAEAKLTEVAENAAHEA